MKVFNEEDIGKEFSIRLLPNIYENDNFSTVEMITDFNNKGIKVKKIAVFGLLNGQLNIIKIPSTINDYINANKITNNLFDLRSDISIKFNINSGIIRGTLYNKYENIRMEKDPKNIIWDGREETKEDVKKFLKSKNLILKNCFDLNVIRHNKLSELGI